MPKILRVFQDADMRCNHPGLSKIAKTHKIDLDKLAPGEYVVFINSSKTMFKMYCHRHVLAHVRSPRGRLEMGAIIHLPESFNGSAIGAYEKGLEKHLKKLLAKKQLKRPTLLGAVRELREDAGEKLHGKVRHQGQRAS